MRQLVPMLVLTVALGEACTCGGPSHSTPVTLRFHNTSNATLYLDDTDGGLGFQVQTQVNGAYATVDEENAACCQACTDVCSGANACQSCPSVPPLLVQVDAGATLERTWSGVYQQTVAATCSSLLSGGQTCERPENAAPTDRFNLHVCYAGSFKAQGGADGGNVFLGTVPPDGVDCVDRVFQVKDGVVEVTPGLGQTCTTSADCSAPQGELCFNGTCTKTCPDEGIPVLGADWALTIPEDDDNYFTENVVGNQRRYSGTGIVGTVQYHLNGPMQLDLHTPDNSGHASLYVTLPGGLGVPFNTGETVTVTLVDPVDDAQENDLALVIHGADGGLLMAADMAAKGFLLSPVDTAPFTVTTAGKTVGCSFTDACGKIVYDATDFTGGDPKAEVIPGQTAEVTAQGSTFTVVNVSNSSSSVTSGCTFPHPQPYAILNKRGTASP